MILPKKVTYYLLEILMYLCITKCLKMYQRLQFYGLYVPILDETPYVITKCTVALGRIRDYCRLMKIRFTKIPQTHLA